MVNSVAGMVMGVWLSASVTAVTIQVAHATEFFCPSGNVTCLIAAINEANLTSGPHTIFLERGIYTLTTADPIDRTSGLPPIRTNLTIRQNERAAIIEGDLDAADFFRIFRVSENGSLSLYGLLLQHGFLSMEPGGAIFNQGVLRTEEVVLHENGVVRSLGGAILNLGKASIYRTSISSNGAEIGGAIFNTQMFGSLQGLGELEIVRSSITRNFGEAGAGAIASNGKLSIIDSSIDENEGEGGTSSRGEATIVNSTVSRNVSSFGPAIISGTGIRIINSTIAGNTSFTGAVAGGIELRKYNLSFKRARQ